VAPGVQLILLRFAETVDAETDCGACGLVVTGIAEEAAEAAEVPAAFVAVTVNVTDALTGMPLTVSGDDAPDAVCPELAVTVKEVAAGESAGKENETTAAPLLYALPVPTFEADTLVGANGSKKSLDAAERLPVFLAIYPPYYAVRSP
jgi:hypothetical protein